ncbi:succinate dehydrogenase membrane ANCHOR subunit [Mycobacterium tuberculosis]|nr:succinate dehydrogenase membrane ANCHOR subunit [Mycobacterium tuberculosis]
MSAPTANRPAIGVFTPTRAQIPERTLRTDLWWLPPLLTNLGLLAFICYATTGRSGAANTGWKNIIT